MERKEWHNEHGVVIYWTSEQPDANRKTLVFLPGLSAEHHLFDYQIKYFETSYNCLTWDAPAHAESRPYELTFSLQDVAKLLHEILEKEHISQPIIIGQSYGAYITQMYMELFPNTLSGFVSIDSAPLQLKYYKKWELWVLQYMEPAYRFYPNLIRSVINSCSETPQGRENMRNAILVYSRKGLCKLTGYGFLTIYNAICENLEYRIDCPTLLICGKQDKAGLTKKYNRNWNAKTGFELVWVNHAGHNSNIDQPDFVNKHIDEFLQKL